MAVEPTELPLQSFENFKKEITKLKEKIDELEASIMPRRHTYDPIDPPERIAIRRLRECLQMLNILERGEEELMRQVLHEIKYITHIIGEAKCRVCGHNWLPWIYEIRYECPQCRKTWIYYSTTKKEEIRLIEEYLDSKEIKIKYNGKEYGPLLCPNCILYQKVKLSDGRIGDIHTPLQVIKKTYYNQLYPYPEGFLLVTAECKNYKCRWRDRKAFPAWMPNTKRAEAEVEPTQQGAYRNFISRTNCPICGAELEYKENFKFSVDINEDLRVRWSLPYPKKGRQINPPPESGVQKRYYMQIYKLEEEYDVGRITLEGTSKLYLKELLDIYEKNLSNREVLSKIFKQLVDFMNSMERVLHYHRTQVMKPPTTTVLIDGRTIEDIVAIGNKIKGICDWIFHVYMPGVIVEYGDQIMIEYNDFLEALKRMQEWTESMDARIDQNEIIYTLETDLRSFTEVLNKLKTRIPNLEGMVDALKNAIMDRLFITKRQLEIWKTTVQAVGTGKLLGPISGAGKPPIRDMVIAHMGMNQDRAFNISELLTELGLPDERKTRKRMKELLASLARKGIIKKIAKDKYKFGGGIA